MSIGQAKKDISSHPTAMGVTAPVNKSAMVRRQRTSLVLPPISLAGSDRSSFSLPVRCSFRRTSPLTIRSSCTVYVFILHRPALRPPHLRITDPFFAFLLSPLLPFSLCLLSSLLFVPLYRSSKPSARDRFLRTSRSTRPSSMPESTRLSPSTGCRKTVSDLLTTSETSSRPLGT
jgi:hypothetical protein